MYTYCAFRSSRAAILHEEGVQPRKSEVLVGCSRTQEGTRVRGSHQEARQGDLGVSVQHYFLKMGHLRPLFRLFSVTANKHYIF